VFQVVVQDRPYRKGMEKDNVMMILEDMVEKGQLNGSVVSIIIQNSDYYYQTVKDKEIVKGCYSNDRSV
jgi:HD-GYP domain-containing protein (c-di-GMP phosphodiesterase class II)